MLEGTAVVVAAVVEEGRKEVVVVVAVVVVVVIDVSHLGENRQVIVVVQAVCLALAHALWVWSLVVQDGGCVMAAEQLVVVVEMVKGMVLIENQQQEREQHSAEPLAVVKLQQQACPLGEHKDGSGSMNGGHCKAETVAYLVFVSASVNRPCRHVSSIVVHFLLLEQHLLLVQHLSTPLYLCLSLGRDPGNGCSVAVLVLVGTAWPVGMVLTLVGSGFLLSSACWVGRSVYCQERLHSCPPLRGRSL